MKKYLIIGSIVAILLTIIGFLSGSLKKAKEERDIARHNVEVLSLDNKHYKTKDSLSAISIGKLELKYSELEKYRSDDVELIKTLQVDKKRLESINKARLETIYNLKGNVGDSIIYRDREKLIIDTLKCLNITDAWFSLDGCIDNDIFDGRFISKDSLVYVEHIIPKRFLGFLWKYGVKERRQEIVSKNPNTQILDAEFISIRK